MELPGMTAEQLLDEGQGDQDNWEPPVKNLDKFFSIMYQYYTTKGLPAIVIQQLCSVISLGFTITFSIFLIAFVDWDRLGTCRDELSCEGNFVIVDPLGTWTTTFTTGVIIYGILFGSFWVWRLLAAIDTILGAVTMERFYRQKLGLRLSDLTDIQWNDVVQRLIRLHEHGIHRVAVKEKLTEHDVVLRIMRKDNYLIGLINKKLLGECQTLRKSALTDTLI
jgi:autophagy-related protein 9